MHRTSPGFRGHALDLLDGPSKGSASTATHNSVKHNNDDDNYNYNNNASASIIATAPSFFGSLP